MLVIYTGNGKGKTSALVGQVIRAHGQGLRVACGQFMKEAGIAGEQKVLQNILGERFFARGCGFFRKEEDRPAHREAALQVLNWAKTQMSQVDMLALDETLYALGSGLLTQDEVCGLVEEAKNSGVHLVLSGRGLTPWLLELADIVTELGEVKHSFAGGGRATKGIEF